MLLLYAHAVNTSSFNGIESVDKCWPTSAFIGQTVQEDDEHLDARLGLQAFFSSWPLSAQFV